jgi:hypothetical protein
VRLLKGARREIPAGPQHHLPHPGRGTPGTIRSYTELYGEGAPAAASSGGVRVTEGEARPHHGGDVVDLHAFQVLGRKRIHENAQTLELEDLIVTLGGVLDVEAILEPGASAGEDRDPKSGFRGSSMLLDELVDRVGRGGGRLICIWKRPPKFS